MEPGEAFAEFSGFPQLRFHAAVEHLDGRRFLRVGQVEADDFGRLARRCVVEPADRGASRLEKPVTGFETLLFFAFDLKDEAALCDHPAGRDRMPVKSGGLSRSKA